MTARDAMIAKLKATASVTALVSTRIYPGTATQDATMPYLVVEIQSKDSTNRLNGTKSVEKNVIDVTAYAKTETELNNIGIQVVNALQGWRDMGAGVKVQGCFHMDSDGVAQPDEGYRTARHEFNVFQEFQTS